MVDLPFSFKGKNQQVNNLFFSEGTYQMELLQRGEFFWPFLQIDDRGKILDCFCTCADAEQKGHCSHLETMLELIGSPPLHMRFQESIWYQLCLIASRRHGYDPSVLEKTENDSFQILSVTGKLLFSITPFQEDAKEKLEEITSQKTPETEETSLKFSKLSAEELLFWKQGRPSQKLQFELSFWSDLAKWWMLLQEQKKDYQIRFISAEEALPKGISVEFDNLKMRFYIAEVNWNHIIPTLQNVQTPLRVFESKEKTIKNITYDQEKKCFFLDHETLFIEKKKEDFEGIPVGDWVYLPDLGFYPTSPDTLLRESVIPENRIALFLQRYRRLIKKYLSNSSIYEHALTPFYTIVFDVQKGLEIAAYLFTPGDLQKMGSSYFSPWAFLPDRGFYLVEDLHFSSDHFIVPKVDVCDFVDRHRFWLQRFEGYQIHLSSVDTKLTYFVSDRGLYFDTVLDVFEENSELIDLGRLIYIKGRGFYAKASNRIDRIVSGTYIPNHEVSVFIRQHREELETIKGFFTNVCPIEKAGLVIFLNSQRRIIVRPEYTYLIKPVMIFGDYSFVEKQGFCEIPLACRLPDAYRSEMIISPDFEPYFLGTELDILAPYILSIDSRLKKPRQSLLRVKSIKKEEKNSWLLEFEYESEIGSCSVFDVWKGVNENERYLFSSAGLLSLKQSRFHWLKSIPKKRFLKKEKELKLTTLEWIRLAAFETIFFGEDKQPATDYLENFLAFSTPEMPAMEGLQSELRPYQEKGVAWLWFLYCNGLSGLLCDEMGLGKTHQAMSLITVIRKQKKDQNLPFKVLVVSPTSVMYHWQELLNRFLPNLEVVLFHGSQRSVAGDFELLLTSYGVLRGEQKYFSEVSFDLAIFDEVQIAKNTKSQTHKALRGIQADMHLGLTGTPIENALLELKALFDVILPGYMPTESVFKELFVNPVEKNQDPEKKATAR